MMDPFEICEELAEELVDGTVDLETLDARARADVAPVADVLGVLRDFGGRSFAERRPELDRYIGREAVGRGLTLIDGEGEDSDQTKPAGKDLDVASSLLAATNTDGDPDADAEARRRAAILALAAGIVFPLLILAQVVFGGGPSTSVRTAPGEQEFYEAPTIVDAEPADVDSTASAVVIADTETGVDAEARLRETGDRGLRQAGERRAIVPDAAPVVVEVPDAVDAAGSDDEAPSDDRPDATTTAVETNAGEEIETASAAASLPAPSVDAPVEPVEIAGYSVADLAVQGSPVPLTSGASGTSVVPAAPAPAPAANPAPANPAPDSPDTNGDDADEPAVDEARCDRGGEGCSDGNDPASFPDAGLNGSPDAAPSPGGGIALSEFPEVTAEQLACILASLDGASIAGGNLWRHLAGADLDCLTGDVIASLINAGLGGEPLVDADEGACMLMQFGAGSSLENAMALCIDADDLAEVMSRMADAVPSELEQAACVVEQVDAGATSETAMRSCFG